MDWEPLPRWLRWSAWCLVLLAAAAIGTISAGLFDPRPVGTEVLSQRLAPRPVAALSRQAHWLQEVAPGVPFTVRLEAGYIAGELDASYGLLLGSDDEYLAVAISPTGYAAIFAGRDSDLGESVRPPTFILPWQVWPHVKSGTSINEIWLDVSGDVATGQHLAVRINRELFWSGQISQLDQGVGYFAESFAGPVDIRFQEIRLFSPE